MKKKKARNQLEENKKKLEDQIDEWKKKFDAVVKFARDTENTKKLHESNHESIKKQLELERKARIMLEDLRKKHEIELTELKVKATSNIPTPPTFKPPPAKAPPKKTESLQNALSAKQLRPLSLRNDDTQPPGDNSDINVVEILAKSSNQSERTFT